MRPHPRIYWDQSRETSSVIRKHPIRKRTLKVTRRKRQEAAVILLTRAHRIDSAEERSQSGNDNFGRMLVGLLTNKQLNYELEISI